MLDICMQRLDLRCEPFSMPKRFFCSHLMDCHFYQQIIFHKCFPLVLSSILVIYLLSSRRRHFYFSLIMATFFWTLTTLHIFHPNPPFLLVFSFWPFPTHMLYIPIRLFSLSNLLCEWFSQRSLLVYISFCMCIPTLCLQTQVFKSTLS